MLVYVRRCVCVCACMLWPERNMWSRLLKIPNTCRDHEPKQGEGFLFCSSETLLKAETVTFQPPATYNPPATRTRTLSSYTTGGWMECLQTKSEKPFSFHLQVFFHFKPFFRESDLFGVFCIFCTHTRHTKPTWKLPRFFSPATQLPVVGDTAALTNQRSDWYQQEKHQRADQTIEEASLNWMQNEQQQ